MKFRSSHILPFRQRFYRRFLLLLSNHFHNSQALYTQYRLYRRSIALLFILLFDFHVYFFISYYVITWTICERKMFRCCGLCGRAGAGKIHDKCVWCCCCSLGKLVGSWCLVRPFAKNFYSHNKQSSVHRVHMYKWEWARACLGIVVLTRFIWQHTSNIRLQSFIINRCRLGYALCCHHQILRTQMDTERTRTEPLIEANGLIVWFVCRGVYRDANAFRFVCDIWTIKPALTHWNVKCWPTDKRNEIV